MLLSQYSLGGLQLPNRVVMAPMTRARAVGDGLPHPAAATYYAQRASAGLIVTEGAQTSHGARGFPRTPGIHTDEQIAAWRAVVSAVHAAGGRIYLQLWHVGRVSHPEYQLGRAPIGPSALQAEGNTFTSAGPEPLGMPRALELHEMVTLVDEFALAARNARSAGFDGVELHGANGYLLDQFIRDGSNRRTDAYGGSAANRARLPLEIAAAVGEVFGPERVGYRISPGFSMYSMSDSNPSETFGVLAEGLSALGIGYLHVVDPVSATERLTPELRRRFKGALIANGGYDKQSAEAALARGEADLIAFATHFIANPDLPERLRRDAALAEPDAATLYQGEEQGYTTYPALDTTGALS